eukprot:scaffold2391_cov381-Prasinococcus_capsulatus_cf.AAC.11
MRPQTASSGSLGGLGSPYRIGDGVSCELYRLFLSLLVYVFSTPHCVLGCDNTQRTTDAYATCHALTTPEPKSTRSPATSATLVRVLSPAWGCTASWFSDALIRPTPPAYGSTGSRGCTGNLHTCSCVAIASKGAHPWTPPMSTGPRRRQAKSGGGSNSSAAVDEPGLGWSRARQAHQVHGAGFLGSAWRWHRAGTEG